MELGHDTKNLKKNKFKIILPFLKKKESSNEEKNYKHTHLSK